MLIVWFFVYKKLAQFAVWCALPPRRSESPVCATDNKPSCMLHLLGSFIGSRGFSSLEQRPEFWVLHYQHITYGLQSDWLHVCKAILLVQTSRATCLQSNPIGTNFAGFCSNLKQFYWYKRHGLLFKLRRPLAFQLSRGLLLGAY